MSYPFRLLTPERALFEGDVVSVSLRVAGGDIAFLTGHVPMIAEVQISPCHVQREDGTSEVFAVHGGFIEVAADSTALLCPAAEAAAEIDVDRARRAESAASGHAEDPAGAEALRRAQVRIEAASAA